MHLALAVRPVLESGIVRTSSKLKNFYGITHAQNGYKNKRRKEEAGGGEESASNAKQIT